MRTIEDILSEIPEEKIFTKLYCMDTNGYWQIKICDASQKLCTFNTPFDKYSFTRLPFGSRSAGEVYHRAVSNTIQDTEGCSATVYDILIWDKDMKEHDLRLRKVLDRLRENNVRLNSGKCEFRKDSISYVGHVLTGLGCKPDPEKVRAVKDMKRPEPIMGFI